MVKIDLIDHRNDLQIVIHSRIGVGDRLSLDALECIDQEQSSFAASQRSGDFVLKIDVARGVDQVQFVGLPFVQVPKRHGLGFDRDPPLAFEFHRIEELLFHFPGFDRSGAFQESVSQGTFSVINVRDNAEVSNSLNGDLPRRFLFFSVHRALW